MKDSKSCQFLIWVLSKYIVKLNAYWSVYSFVVLVCNQASSTLCLHLWARHWSNLCAEWWKLWNVAWFLLLRSFVLFTAHTLYVQLISYFLLRLISPVLVGLHLCMHVSFICQSFKIDKTRFSVLVCTHLSFMCVQEHNKCNSICVWHRVMEIEWSNNILYIKKPVKI